MLTNSTQMCVPVLVASHTVVTVRTINIAFGSLYNIQTNNQHCKYTTLPKVSAATFSATEDSDFVSSITQKWRIALTPDAFKNVDL